MDGSLLRSKYDRFQGRHETLIEDPDPRLARERFPRVLSHCRHVARLKLGCYVLVYLGAISSAVLAILRFAELVGGVTIAVRVLSAAAPVLAVLGLLGVLACTRVLALLEVDLFYLSVEASTTSAFRGPAGRRRRTAPHAPGRARKPIPSSF